MNLKELAQGKFQAPKKRTLDIAESTQGGVHVLRFSGYLDIKNSVTMASQPIPVTKPNSAPRAVTGVAVWNDIFAEEPDTTRFSIFVTGLSNGYAEVDAPGGKKLLRRKTLQMNFKRLSDRFHLDAEVKFIPQTEWLYRASPLAVPERSPCGFCTARGDHDHGLSNSGPRGEPPVVADPLLLLDGLAGRVNLADVLTAPKDVCAAL